MKLKKKPKRIIITLVILILLAICIFLGYKMFFDKEEVEETKVLKTIDKYGYTLKDNKSDRYKKLFGELSDILSEDKVDEEEYVRKITEMFIYDFYSLNDKVSKTDVGGVDFVYKEVLDNFLVNAEDTYYKYVESNIYNNRKQKLPKVSDVTIESVEQQPFAIEGGATDDKAYYVKVNWKYSDSSFETYQTGAELVFIHNDIRLDLVELQ